MNPTRMQIEANEHYARTLSEAERAAITGQPTPGMQEMLDQLNQQKPATMIEAFETVVGALTPLHEDAQRRVVLAACVLLGIETLPGESYGGGRCSPG